uniref:Uncharacterized protein n=1 Tax=Chlamydomonas sp. HS-5 TaxID=108458 RepID=Q9XFU0_9CHLO|nr:hypothetical protein [Chlamydomonas sp. HS-5]
MFAVRVSSCGRCAVCPAPRCSTGDPTSHLGRLPRLWETSRVSSASTAALRGAQHAGSSSCGCRASLSTCEIQQARGETTGRT